jgi:uncharacterized protein YdgA (DUF945 family)
VRVVIGGATRTDARCGTRDDTLLEPMNKLANVLAALAVVLIVGLPPVLGIVTEAQLRARAAEISQSGVLTADVRSFERGWFRGRAKLDLALAPEYARRLGAANAAVGVAELGPLIGRTAPLDVELAFGPVAFLDGVHFGLSRMIARLDQGVAQVANLERALDVRYLFEFRGRTGFLGALHFDADVPPVDVAADTASVRFSGAVLAGALAGSHLVATGRVTAFELSSRTGSFTVENAILEIDNEIRSRYVLPGSAGFSIQRVSIVDAQREAGANTALEVAGLRLSSVVEESNGLLDAQATLVLASALVEGTAIADARAGIALRNIDAAALETYAASARTLGPSATADPGAGLRDLRPAIERALGAGPSVTLDPVSFSYEGEPFTARVEIMTNPAALPAGATLDFENPGTLLTLLDGAAEVDVSKELTQRLARVVMQAQLARDPTMSPEQRRLFAEVQSGLILVTLVSQGFLTDAGRSYRTELRVTDGAVTVNGAALPFSVP